MLKNMELKIITYAEPIDTEEKKEMYRKKRNYSAYYPTVANVVYNYRTKIFYEGLTSDVYRGISHEALMEYCGIDYEHEPENYIRITFSTYGAYDGNYHFDGNYVNNDLGITGLKLSEIYHYCGAEKINNLKAYDLDLIESYCQKIKQEQVEIRENEANLLFSVYNNVIGISNLNKIRKIKNIDYINTIQKRVRGLA